MKRIVICLLLLLATSMPAYADSRDDPPVAPTDSDLLNYPDIAGYISIGIPNPIADQVCADEPTGNWFDIGFQLSHLAWLIRQQYLNLICAFVSILQALANGLANALNSIAIAINSAWRFGLFVWFTIRAWILSLWGLIEYIRQAINQVEIWLLLFNLYVQMLISLGIEVLAIGGQLINSMLAMAGAMSGMLGWITGFAFGLISSILTALNGTTMPTQLTSTSNIYQYVRGFGEGLTQSAISWVFVLIWAMCYVAFVAWLARFLSSGGTE